VTWAGDGEDDPGAGGAKSRPPEIAGLVLAVGASSARTASVQPVRETVRVIRGGSEETYLVAEERDDGTLLLEHCVQTAVVRL
jgi:hypothetical protein